MAKNKSHISQLWQSQPWLSTWEKKSNQISNFVRILRPLVQVLQPSWGASLPEPAHVCLWPPLSFMISWTFWVEETLWIRITFLFNLFWLTQTWLTSMPPKIKERNHFKSIRAYSPILLHERYFVAYSAMGGANLLFLQGVFCNSSISSHWVPFWQLKIFYRQGL